MKFEKPGLVEKCLQNDNVKVTGTHECKHNKPDVYNHISEWIRQYSYKHQILQEA